MLGVKIFSLSIAAGIIAIALSELFPVYRVPIVYAGCGVIIYLMVLTVRKTVWKAPDWR